MAAIAVFLLAGLLLASPSWARRPKPSQSPIDKISAQEGFDPTRFAGKWFLVGVASDCLYLRENGYQVEATNVVVSVRDRDSLHFSTFRPLEGICWNIKQNYFAGKAPGRFLLKGERPEWRRASCPLALAGTNGPFISPWFSPPPPSRPRCPCGRGGGRDGL
uniref:Lipocalin/cytosolic fatty-acid binding domain-containing protein n=1 Tax=Pseudonaja textilis TaxID=8673 RepID=A0A670ZA14_PSETE